MRLLLTLTPKDDMPQPIDHGHLQGVLYKAFDDLGLRSIHEKPGTKYFCFSNLYPYQAQKPFVRGKGISWQVSSPNKALITRLSEYFMITRQVHIGPYTCDITKSVPYELRIPKDEVVVQAGTPLYTRVPQYKCEQYGIPKETGKPYVEWNIEHPLNPFIKQLHDNLIKKYKGYTGTESDVKATGGQTDFIRGFKYLKKGSILFKKNVLHGQHWQFVIPLQSRQMHTFIAFALETGFGEKNSSGLGFMNIVNI